MAKGKHTFWNRFQWHPFFAGALLGWTVFSGLQRGFGWFRIGAVVFLSMWFLMSVYDWWSGHRLLDWMYTKETGDAETREGSAEEAAADAWQDRKSKLMELALGKEHDMVMHAMVPYAVGGALDLYYYPNGIAGTGIATKELSALPNRGSSNKVFTSYELVMFTRHELSMDDAREESTAFGKAHRNMSMLLNMIARYSEEATLNPRETSEFPEGMESVGGKCLIFDGYDRGTPGEWEGFGLMLVMEVFRSEMDFARAEGTGKLIELLKEKKVYPYSDMERAAVV